MLTSRFRLIRTIPGALGIAASFAFAMLSAAAAEKAMRLDELTHVEQARWNHDGTRVLVRLENQTHSLWNAATGAPVALDADWPAAGAAATMSADARSILVVFKNQGVRVFDATSGAARSPVLPAEPRDRNYPQAVFSPNAATLIVFEQKEAAVFEIASGRRVATLSIPEGTAEDEITASACFTEDGARCFVMGETGIVTCYDAMTWKPLGKPLHHPPAESAYTFGFTVSEDARWLATFDHPGENGPKGQLQLWDLQAGRALGKLFVAVNGMAAAFLPSAHRVLLLPGRGEASARELPSLKPSYVIRAHDEVDGPNVEASPDGKWIVSWGADQSMRIIDAATGTLHESHVFHAAISQVLLLPDSTGFLVVFDNTAFLAQDHFDHYVIRLSFRESKITHTLRLTEPLHRATLSPDGRRLLVQSGEKQRVLLFDAANLQRLAP
jgi:WD40 repeat protein